MGRIVDMLDIQNMAVGQKDVHKSLFDVWRVIFELPKMAGKYPSERDLKSRCSQLVQMSASCGDEERLRWGVFENYPIVISPTDCIRSASSDMDWFLFVDRLNCVVFAHQTFQLLGYQNYLPVAFHLAFGSISRSKLVYPHMDYAMTQKGRRNRDTLNTVMNVAGSIRNSFVFVTDVMPFVHALLCPVLRPVNAQLYSVRELSMLQHVVSLMINFGLIYRQQCSIDGQYDYVFEPPMDDLIVYPLDTMANSLKLVYSAKQMIAREVNQELMRNRERNRSTMVNSTTESVQMPKRSKGLWPSSLFGAKRTNETGHKRRTTSKIWFKYNEGYSNAIRRNIRMQDLVS